MSGPDRVAGRLAYLEDRDLGALLAYDPSLAGAARQAGLTVLAPGE